MIECVPNFSEGQDPAVLRALVDAIAAVPGVAVLGSEANADHHRSVVTLELTGSGQRLVSAVSGWRQRELSRIVAALPPATQVQLTSVLGQLVTAAGEGYGLTAEPGSAL